LDEAGISFKPRTYLSDEWGCPHRVPVIGIPFYLANPVLRQLEGLLSDEEAEDEAEVMMYLRHEAGHAFNYAYRLYAKPEWRRIFGLFSQPYREEYRANPFSPKYVHHIPGWYAQKHPDDDFAETFAVWLTPGSRWQEVYDGTPALAKLQYVERVARRYGRQPPSVTSQDFDMPLEELSMTLSEWYGYDTSNTSGPTLHPIINEDLRILLPGVTGQPAENVLQENRRLLIRTIHYWTGIDRHVLAKLFSELLDRVRALGLKVDTDQINTRIMGVTVFLTTLALNYQRSGQYTET
jgi:hypothetical protein